MKPWLLHNKLFVVLALVFVGVVVLANWLASKYVISVWLTPYVAPAGAYMIGAILVLRDWLQQRFGFWLIFPLVFVAGFISLGMSYALNLSTPPGVSLASVAWGSMIAFTISETVEAAVFTPIRKRSLALGVGLSGTVGLALDSWIFLWIAFGSLAFFWGQFWAKFTAVCVGVILTALRRWRFPVTAS